MLYKSGRLHTDTDVLPRHPFGPLEFEPVIPMLMYDPSSLTFPDSPDIPLLQRECLCRQNIIGRLRKKIRSNPTRRLTSNFFLKNDVLYHYFFRTGQAFHQLYVSSELVDQIPLACHDDVSAVHLGTTIRTPTKINQRFFWPKMTRQVTNYVRSCEECQTKTKPKERPVGYLEPTSSDSPIV